MIGDIAAAVGRARGIASARFRGARRRHAVGLVIVVVFLALSGYLAAGDVTVDFGTGEDVERVQGGAVAADAENGRLPPGVVTGTETDRPDTDDDGLADRAEREIYGTDPTESDTDGDGIPDGAEVGCSDAYPDADPLREDVYVEVDAVEGADLATASADALREIFADAPVAVRIAESLHTGTTGSGIKTTRQTGVRRRSAASDERRERDRGRGAVEV